MLVTIFPVNIRFIISLFLIQVTDTFKPVVSAGDHVVEDGRIPTGVTCEDDMRKCLPLVISAGAECHARESAEDVKLGSVCGLHGASIR